MSMQDMGSIMGQKIVEIINITKDKKLSSGDELGWRKVNLNQLMKK
ncbi:MAG: hypothetical protein AAF915_13635 [Cyanobacteria bacterium P01_D01_bin.50]